jgi:hypothetical protein
MKTKLRLTFGILLALGAVRSEAQPYAINQATITGGGGASTGGVFTISATIGQHDVGSMSGGAFTLTGGFWAPVVVQTPGAPLLSITPAGPGQATLTWTPDAPGFHLQMSDSLASPAWTNAASGTNHPITIPATGPMRFYRLVQP